MAHNLHPYQQRIDQFRKSLIQNDFDGAIISNKSSICYLTGLRQLHPTNREALLFISSDQSLLYHSLFLIPPNHSWLNTQIMTKSKPLDKLLTKFFSNVSQLGFESKNLTASEYFRFKNILNQATLSSIDEHLSHQRQIKDEAEAMDIQNAINISKMTLSHFLKQLPRLIGITEIQLMHQINSFMLEQGAEDQSFPTLVAFDHHSASPHHVANDKTLSKNSVVLIDLGAKYASYCSDMTRTVKLGKPDPTYEKIKATVDHSYQKAMDKLSKFKNNTSSNLIASELDHTARSIISKTGFAKQFFHTTGHGIGLDIHEAPSIGPNNSSNISPGMVFTIEPGIYLEGKFGFVTVFTHQ